MTPTKIVFGTAFFCGVQQEQRETIALVSGAALPYRAKFLWQRPAVRDRDKLVQGSLERLHPLCANDRCPLCFQMGQDGLSFPHTVPAMLCEESDLFVSRAALVPLTALMKDLIEHDAGRNHEIERITLSKRAGKITGKALFTVNRASA